MRRILSILALFLVLHGRTQVSAPSLRCISCNSSGDLTLTWVIPPDPGSQFFSYDIYRSITTSGFVKIASVTTYSLTSYTDVGALGNTQSKYYYIRTVYGASGTNTSTPSDTLRSIHLTLANTSNGTPDLFYNNLHIPKLSTSSSTFDIYRQYASVWNKIKSTSAVTFKDSIYSCSPALYSYQVQLADNSGCLSTSNVDSAVMEDKSFPLVGQVDSLSVNQSGQTLMGWKPSPTRDCRGYYIYRDNGTIIKIDSVYGRNTTNYTWTNTTANLIPVKLTIVAFDSCGRVSPYDTPIQATIHFTVTYNMCARTAQLSWTSYGNMPGGILEYDVYSQVNSGPWSKIGTTNNTAFAHNGLEPGKTYCYYVRAKNTSKQITSSSNMGCLIATAPQVSSYAYIKTVTVKSDQNVGVNVLLDSAVSCKGFNIYKAEETGSFFNIGFVAYNGGGNYWYTDANVDTKNKNYYYKVEILDSCGNPRFTSSISKTILLKVKSDPNRLFENSLSWNDYAGWMGSVAGYNIYRIVNEIPETTPVNFVPFGSTTYNDNVEDLVPQSGKVGYFVEAVESFGNPYGITGYSTSNHDFAYVEANVFVPNAFAPKGLNRKWLPVTQFVEKTEYHVSVYNRWGQKVWETDQDTEGWDGSGMEDGVYAYIISYKNARGEYVELKGTITMVR